MNPPEHAAPEVTTTKPPSLGVVLLLVSVFALLFRALHGSFFGGPPILEVDGAYWGSLAAAMARGDWAHGWSAAWPPLYPAAIAAVARAAGGATATTPATIEWAARAVSWVAGGLTAVALLPIADRLAPRRAAVLVVLAAVFHPRLVEYSNAALSESLFTLLLTAGVAALVVAESPRGDARPARWHAAGGAAFGLAFLTRPEALPLGAGLWLVGLARRPASGSRWRPWFVAVMLLVSLPWLAFLRQETGGWTLGEKGPYNFWRAHRGGYAKHFAAPVALPARVNRSPELAPPAAPGELRLAEFVAREPLAVASRTLRQLGTILVSSLPVAVGWLVAAAALAGLFLRAPGPWWPVIAPLALVPLLVAPFSVDRRFFVPLTPLALALAGALFAWFERSRIALVRSWAGWAFVLLLSGYTMATLGRGDRAPEHRAAGEWLGAHAPGERPAVMARKPWVAFYSGGLIADLPDAPPDSILADAARTGVTVLVADARAARGDRPQLSAWLTPGAAPPGWRELARWNEPDTLVLFRREPAGP